MATKIGFGGTAASAREMQAIWDAAPGPTADGAPLIGAAAVRELTSPASEEPCDCGFKGLGLGGFHYPGVPGCRYGLSRPTTADVELIAAAMTGDRLPMTPTERAAWLTAGGTAQVLTADVENDGDRGPRLRDPLASIDAAAQGQHARAVADLVAAAMGLHVDEVRILVWIARAMPREKLRSACEAATATGWCDTNDEKNPALRTEVDGARAATLAAVRAIEPLIGAARTARRGRDEVLADEAARRVGGDR